MLHIRFSNRSEALLDAIVADMASAPASPFVAEQLIVPGAAQRRAVTLALAERRGVCANVGFSFLAQWLWTQMSHFVGIREASPFAAPALEWRIRELFDDAGFVARLGALRGYVEAADPLLRYELARQVAALFETYVTYRPGWLAAWSAGERVPDLAGDAVAATHEGWQALLWERVARDVGIKRQHPSVAFFAEIEKLGPDAARIAGLPQRAFFYALPSVPPLYLQILKRLSRWIDLHLYVLNPCREFWYEIVDRRRLHWLEASGRAAHHEVGNALLAGWGRQTRAFVDLLLSEGGEEAILDDAGFVAAADTAPQTTLDGGSMLQRLQDSLLDLVELAPGSLAAVAADRSIEVHACHSLSRQLEALRDQLLAAFAADATLQPSQVLVLLPDLDTAAPLIEAVFGTGGSRRIPYAITGRSPEATNAVADLLLRLLALPATRLAAAEVFDLLQHPLVARRLCLDDEALLRIHDWIRESGMRWGLDGRHRLGAGALATDAGADTPADDAAMEAFSLRDGLSRLLLGHALPADDSGAALCGGLLPAGDAVGSSAGELGSLWAFVEALAATLETLRRPRPAAAWPRLLNGLLSDWVDGGQRLEEEDIGQLQAVRAAIDKLAGDLATAGLGLPDAAGAGTGHAPAEAPGSPVGVDIVRAALSGRLEGSAHGGVPTGSVTFSALSAFRGIPARLVCLLGLDDGVFPRQARPAEFDLMPRAPQRGDRQSRDDDRNLFLDLLLGARERFQLYFNGHSIRDNAPLPPSVLVAELLDTLAAAIAPAGADAAALKAARAGLVVEHPLQSFSLSLFDAQQPGHDPRRSSYDAETCAAWQAALRAERTLSGSATPAVVPAAAEADDDEAEEDAPPEPGQPFFPAPLSPPGPEWRRVALPRLLAFFRHPARVLLRERLRLRFDYVEEALPDEDPFALDWAARRRLWSALLPAETQARSLHDPEVITQPGVTAGSGDLARAMRLAPAGMVGELLIEAELDEIGRMAATIAELRRSPARPDHDFVLDVELAGSASAATETWQIHGLLADLHADGQLLVRDDDAYGREYLDAWLRHLLLNACAPDDVAPVTVLLARNGCRHFMPVDDAAERLTELLGFYRAGLTAPLHFYPKSAWAYAEGGDNLGKARAIWSARRPNARSEGDDPWWALALRGVAEPLDDEFMTLAAAIYGPMLAAMQDPAKAGGAPE